MRFLTTMDEQMTCETVFLCKPLEAYTALIILLSSMKNHVFHEALFHGKRFGAQAAPMGLFTFMSDPVLG